MLETFAAFGSDDLTALVAALAVSVRGQMRAEDQLPVRVLMTISAAGRRGVSQRETARGLDVAEATVSRLCDQLEATGLIERAPHPTDRRVKMLHLTPAGEAHIRRCADSASGGLGAALVDLTPAERDLLTRLLSRVKAAAGRPRTCDGCLVGGCRA